MTPAEPRVTQPNLVALGCAGLRECRIIVCGGRQYADRERVFAVLDMLHVECIIALVIHGGAPGADRLAADWAMLRVVPIAAYIAQWNRDGRAAGPIRNQLMLNEAKPSLVVAFLGGRGTADLVKRARLAGVKVIEVLP